MQEPVFENALVSWKEKTGDWELILSKPHPSEASVNITLPLAKNASDTSIKERIIIEAHMQGVISRTFIEKMIIVR